MWKYWNGPESYWLKMYWRGENPGTLYTVLIIGISCNCNSEAIEKSSNVATDHSYNWRIHVGDGVTHQLSMFRATRNLTENEAQ